MSARRLRRVARGIALVLLLALAVAIGLFAWSRMAAPTAAQRAALALIEARTPAPGDAEGRAWLRYALRLEVPDDEVQAVAARELANWRARGEPIPAAGGEGEALRALEAPCDGEACLAALRAEPALAATLERWTPAVARMRRGLAYARLTGDEAWDQPVTPDVPALRAVWRTHASAFVRGEREAAIDATCTDIGHLRRHARQPANLWELLAYGALADIGGRLLGAMLAEAPAIALPPSCTVLAAAATDDPAAPLCAALAGEHPRMFAPLRALGDDAGRVVEAGITEAPAALRPAWRASAWLGIDPGTIEAPMAEDLAAFCGDEAARALRDDADTRLVRALPSPRTIDWIAQPGLVLATRALALSEDRNDWPRYLHRQADARARERLLAARLLLHGSDAAVPLAERVAALPAWVHSPTRRVEVGGDGASLQVVLYGHARPDTYVIAMPAADPGPGG